MEPRRSPAVCVLRALRLLDPILCELGAGARDEASWLAEALLGRADIDEARLAADLTRDVLARDADPIEGLFALGEDLVQLRHGVPRCADAALWHQVGYEIDADVVVAAKLSGVLRGPRDPAEWVKALSWPSVLATDDRAVEGVLSSEIADTHVHLGGALPGSFYWITCMCGFARLHRVGAWSRRDPELWIRSITTARETRQRLFRRCLDADPGAGVDLDLGTHSSPEEPFCDYVLRWLVPSARERLMYNPALGERYLLRSALARLRIDPHDTGLRRELVAYLRCRNSFVRNLSHGPGHRGLERFQTTFRRQHLLVDDRVRGDRRLEQRRRRAQASAVMLERFRMRHALRYQFSDPTDAPWARDHGVGLGAGAVAESPWRPPRQVELRVSPILGRSQLRVLHAQLQGLHDFVTRERDAPLLRAGLVFHVHRYADPERSSEVARWQIEGLLAVLDDVPDLRPFVVGIDAAGAEVATAPRDLAPCFLSVKRRADHEQGSPGAPPLRLGRTCHAGEDFRDLLTGLRYVDDAVALLELGAGDRIGHGLALARIPATWYRARSHVYPLLGDHVLDLVWGRSLAQERGDTDVDAKLARRLRDHLPEAARRGRERAWEDHVQEIVRAYEDTCRFRSERDLLDALGVGAPRSCAPVVVDRGYVDLVTQLRAWVVRRVADAGIVIEACPTSNLLVGGFSSYERLPYLNLNHAHLPGAPPDDPELPVSINSDDPGIFQTTIANEYRLLGEAMIRDGHPRRAVVAWLDEARRVGVESTFIPPWSPPTRPELLYLLRRLWIGR